MADLKDDVVVTLSTGAKLNYSLSDTHDGITWDVEGGFLTVRLLTAVGSGFNKGLALAEFSPGSWAFVTRA